MRKVDRGTFECGWKLPDGRRCGTQTGGIYCFTHREANDERIAATRRARSEEMKRRWAEDPEGMKAKLAEGRIAKEGE